MSVSDADIAFAMDLFSGLGQVTSRKMFGGLGLYNAGKIFGLVSSDGQIFLKTNKDLAKELADKGESQFHNMPYWSLPESALDDAETACALANRFLASAPN